jgi:hypothetical protein
LFEEVNLPPDIGGGALSKTLRTTAARHTTLGPEHQRTLRDHLIKRLEDMLVALLGEPNSRDSANWRWGSRGSLSVNMSEKRGVWYSHEDKVGGDIVKLLAWKWDLDPDTNWPEFEARATALLDELPEEQITDREVKMQDQSKWPADQAIEKFWNQGGELTDHHGKAYLRGRRIDPENLPRTVVREAQHKSNTKPETNLYPALVFATIDANENVVGIHAVRCPQGVLLDNAAKITNGQLNGAAIKIPGSSTQQGEIIIVEGPEDALSIWQETGIETWAACSIGNLSAAPVRATQRVVVIGDADGKTEDNTRAACAKLAKRCASVRLVFPAGDHKDANDILMSEPDNTAEIFGELIKSAKPVSAPQEHATRRCRLVTLEHMMASLGPTDWLIEDHLESGTLTLMYGQPKTGKSFVALDYALSVAAGISFHGMPVKQGAVVYVAGEGHAGLARRIQAWCTEQSVPAQSLPMVFTTRGQALTDRAEAEALQAEIDELVEQTGHKIRMIVVDTLNRNFGGANENNTGDMTAFINNLDTLKAEYGATILIVHHSGHGNDHRERGSSALYGAVDAKMKVTKTDSRVLLNFEAMKDGEPPQPKSFSTHVVEFEVPGGEVANSLVLRDEPTSATELNWSDFFKKYPELQRTSRSDKFTRRMPGILSAMFGGKTEWKRIAGAYSGKSKGTFDGYIKRLRSAGLVDGDKYALTDDGKEWAFKLDGILALSEGLSSDDHAFISAPATGQNTGLAGEK